MLLVTIIPFKFVVRQVPFSVEVPAVYVRAVNYTQNGSEVVN